MLRTNSLDSTNNSDKFDITKYVTLPFESTSIERPHENEIKIIKNYIMKRSDDGTMELVYNEEVQNNENILEQITPQQKTCQAINSEFPQLIQNQEPQIRNLLNRSILLQPTQRNNNITHLSQEETAVESCKEYPEISTTEKKMLQKQMEVNFKCIKCNDEFTTITSYRKHVKGHKSTKTFCCSKCSAGYNVEINLKIHIVTAHPSHSDICPICKVRFSRKASLNSHMLVHQVEELFTCDECQAEFDNEDELIKHMEFHAISKASCNSSLVCPYCKLDFNTSQEYKNHISLHIKIRKTVLRGKRSRKKRNGGKFSYICKQCGKKFAKSCLLERHERIHTGEKPFVCQFCNRGFAQKGTLQIHIGSHIGVKPYACTLCPAKFNQKGNLRAHIEKTHTAPKGDQKMYKCSQCACIFKKISTLNGHVTRAHTNNQDDDSSLVNSVINKLKFLQPGTQNFSKTPLNIDKHKKDHVNKLEGSTNINESQCYVKLTEADRNGGVRRYLVKQKKIGDVRWYFCNYCSSRFKKPSDLIRHVRVHTKEKPFECHLCSASFSLKSTLLNHIKTHEKGGNKCIYCDNVFKNTRCLNAHIRRHEKHNIPNYICILCNQVFQTLEKGKLHRENHKDEIKNTQNIIEPILKQRLHQTAYGSLPPKQQKPNFPNTGSESSTDRPHYCTLCDARFKRLINLKRHIQFHTGDRRFKCYLCPKAFITGYRLKEHLNYHGNIRNYDCKICTKKFVTASLLKRHLIVHNTSKPYMCPYCKKNFKTLLLCRIHIKNVHKQVTVISKDSNLGEEVENDNNCIKKPTAEVRSILTDHSIKENSVSNIHVQVQDVASQNIPNQQIYELPVQENSIILNIQEENQDLNQINYQTLFVNLGDMPSNNNVDSSNVFKLQNDTLLLNSVTGLQNTNIIFNIDNLKPDMVDPNEVFKSNTNEKLPSLSTEIAKISEKTIKLNTCNEKNDKGITLVAENLTSLLKNNVYQDIDLALPVNITNESNVLSHSNLVTDGNIVNTNVTFHSESVFNGSHIICVNCHKLYTDLTIFQDHVCEQINTASSNKITAASNANQEGVAKSKEENVVAEAKNIKKTDSKKSQFKCSVCMSIYANKHTYNKHMATNHSEQSANSKVCKFCYKEFKKPSDLKRHVRTHTGEKPFACNLCDKKFSLKSTLESHKKTHDVVQKSVACVVCNSMFSSKSSLKVHMLLHSGQKPHACTFCNQKFRTCANKKSHERTNHLLKTKSAQSKLKVTNMLESVAAEITPNVNFDTHNFTGDENQTLIQINEQIPESQPLQQESLSPDIISTETFSIDPVMFLQQLQNSGIIITADSVDGTTEGVAIHLSDVTLLDLKSLEQGTVSLEQNDAILDTTELNKNIDCKLIKKRDVQKVECDICHKMYASKDVLRKHKKKVHSQSKKFPCIKCDKGFSNIEELNKHIKFHTGYRPYACQDCSNSFTEEQNLKTHIKRIHQKSNISQETTSALLNLQFDLPLNSNDDKKTNSVLYTTLLN